MSSEPSERAKSWALENLPGNVQGSMSKAASVSLAAFDAGHAEGEKKGTAVGYLAALRETYVIVEQATEVSLLHWLDRRIREAEENANG